MKKAFLVRLTADEFNRMTALAGKTALSREAFVKEILRGNRCRYCEPPALLLGESVPNFFSE